MGRYRVRTSIYSQFSEVKFSSVALADVGQSEKQVGLGRGRAYRRHRRRHSAESETLHNWRKGGMRDQVKYGICKAQSCAVGVNVLAAWTGKAWWSGPV